MKENDVVVFNGEC